MDVKDNHMFVNKFIAYTQNSTKYSFTTPAENSHKPKHMQKMLLTKVYGGSCPVIQNYLNKQVEGVYLQGL